LDDTLEVCKQILAGIIQLLAESGRAKQEFLSVEDAAAVLGLKSDKVIRGAMRRGELPYSNLSTEDGPDYRVTRADLLAWVESRRVGRPPLAAPQGAKPTASPARKAGAIEPWLVDPCFKSSPRAAR
jgi:hypothetical protein